MSDGYEHEHDDDDEATAMPIRFLMPQMPTREQIEAHHMQMQASQHDLYRLFTELSQEHLQSVSRMLHIISCNDPKLVDYFEGIATGILNTKYNICMACGVDHDKEIHTMVAGEEDTDGGGS